MKLLVIFVIICLVSSAESQCEVNSTSFTFEPNEEVVFSELEDGSSFDYFLKKL